MSSGEYVLITFEAFLSQMMKDKSVPLKIQNNKVFSINYLKITTRRAEMAVKNGAPLYLKP